MGDRDHRSAPSAETASTIPAAAGESARTAPGTGTLTNDPGDLVAAPDWLETGTARYHLGDEIASGGGGRVVNARDRRLGRAVAIKIPLAQSGSAERLVREARLLARLEHPSIVSVHDLERGPDGQPCYVMKLLEGDTLRARIQGRAFEERITLLPTLIAIADAIAYAHHRGVIHRDLKPSNVVVGDFGETSVIDWGLARTLATPGDGDDAADPSITLRDDGVTVTGAVVGTPAYMAPEQARGERVDARADVYGLGALCYHVLAGEPPYGGADSAAVVAAVLDGPPRPVAAREPRIPAELGAIVAKAMARAPGDRYATAHDLAADLRRYQAGRLVAAHRYTVRTRVRRWLRRHRVAIAGGVAAAGAAAALFLAWPAGGRDPGAMCRLAGEQSAAGWTPAVRAGIVERVRATGAAGSPVMADRIAERLDRQVADLAAARVEACAATHVRGEQSAELLDRRTSCLDRHRDTLLAVVDLFDAVTPEDVEALGRAVDGMPGLTNCADAEQLRAISPLPADPVTRQQVVALQARSATAYALWLAGRYEAMLTEARAIEADAAVKAYPPLAARVRYLVGTALRELGKDAESEPALREAIALADAAGDDVGRGEDMLQLGYTLRSLERTDEARRILADLEAVATRTGRRDLEAYRLSSLAEIAMKAGELAQSIELGRQAVEAMKSAGRGDWEMAGIVANLGVRLMSAGRWKDAEPYVRESMALMERTRGPDHPHLARILRNLAALLSQTGRAEESIPVYARALAILDRNQMADSDLAVSLRMNLPGSLGMLGRHAEAETEMLALLELVRRRPAAPTTNETIATVQFNLGFNRRLMKDPRGAEAWFAKSLAIVEPALGPDHIKVANGRHGLASAYVDQGQMAKAIPLLEAALPVQLAQTGPDSQFTSNTLLSLAQAHLGLGQHARALAYATRAEKFFLEHPDPGARADFKFIHARALVGDRAKARQLAADARADWQSIGDADQVKTVDAWLATQPP